MTDAAPDAAPLRSALGSSLLALVASSGTLVCCVLPALMVSLGAGAALAGLVTAWPQLIWLSEHKAAVFGSAATLLLVSGLLLHRTRRLPCPVDPALAHTCRRLRRWNAWIWGLAVFATALGALFAFALPLLTRS
jgi:hypothetical protein